MFIFYYTHAHTRTHTKTFSWVQIISWGVFYGCDPFNLVILVRSSPPGAGSKGSILAVSSITVSWHSVSEESTHVGEIQPFMASNSSSLISLYIFPCSVIFSFGSSNLWTSVSQGCDSTQSSHCPCLHSPHGFWADFVFVQIPLPGPAQLGDISPPKAGVIPKPSVPHLYQLLSSALM